MVISLMAFVLFLGISALIGISRHNNLDVLVSDLKGFLWLFLVPVAIAVIGDRERLHIVMKCIVVGATIQAILIIGLDIFSIYFKSSYTALHSKLIQLQISFLDNITDSMFRVFFKSLSLFNSRLLYVWSTIRSLEPDSNGPIAYVQPFV